ncbi:hypothetical protein [Odoribacter laneus]
MEEGWRAKNKEFENREAYENLDFCFVAVVAGEGWDFAAYKGRL